jgi:hypothetical protein
MLIELIVFKILIYNVLNRYKNLIFQRNHFFQVDRLLDKVSILLNPAREKMENP